MQFVDRRARSLEAADRRAVQEDRGPVIAIEGKLN